MTGAFKHHTEFVFMWCKIGVLPPCTTYMHDTANDMDRKTSEPQRFLKCDAMNKEAGSLKYFLEISYL